MSFGNDTLIFRHLVKSGQPDEGGNYQETTVDTPAPGCRHRPLTFKEITEMGLDIATEYWRSTIPLKDYRPDLLAVVLSAAARDEIQVGGATYQIVGGVRPHGDMASVPFKMTIVSQRQHG